MPGRWVGTRRTRAHFLLLVPILMRSQTLITGERGSERVNDCPESHSTKQQQRTELQPRPPPTLQRLVPPRKQQPRVNQEQQPFHCPRLRGCAWPGRGTGPWWARVGGLWNVPALGVTAITAATPCALDRLAEALSGPGLEPPVAEPPGRAG